jgi:3-oxoacyl-[acyl-carrier-protein] synthase III
MSIQVGIAAPYYVVGELELDVDGMQGRRELLADYGMPDIKELWGWQSYRKSGKRSVDLAYETAAGTLASSGIAAADVDALFVCSCDGLNYYAQNGFLSELSARLGLGNNFSSWIGGAGCVSLFSAIRLAACLVGSGAFRNVLVVSVDRVANETSRFQRYGVLSDGACSLLVTAAAQASYAIAGVKVMTSPASLANGGIDFEQKCELIDTVFAELRACADFDTNDAAVFGTNVFVPVQELELSVMPVDSLQAYQKNVLRYGHCYASDPLINLVDFYAEPGNTGVVRSIMASTAHGHFGVVLLQRL